MTTFTLPAPVFEPARPKSRNRTITYYIEGTEAPAPHGGVERKAVQVTVGHSKERKQFYASANQVTITIEPGSYFNSVAFWLFNGVTLARQPVARYSDKALDVFRGQVIKFFESQVAVTPKLQAMFTDTDGEAP